MPTFPQLPHSHLLGFHNQVARRCVVVCMRVKSWATMCTTARRITTNAPQTRLLLLGVATGVTARCLAKPSNAGSTLATACIFLGVWDTP